MTVALQQSQLIRPEWPAPENIGAFSTTRRGGVSRGPWASFNLGLGCGDREAHVLENRRRLNDLLPAEPMWLRQVHGARVVDSAIPSEQGEEADGRVTSTLDAVVAIMTADCLPVLLCDEGGTRVGAAHAGWRGLASGVIEATVECMDSSPERLLAWLGPCISGAVYEVGEDVRRAFGESATFASRTVDVAFSPHGERWLLDIERAARIILDALGVSQVYGGGFCTYREADRFFSHRRDGVTGRMTSLIWLA